MATGKPGDAAGAQTYNLQYSVDSADDKDSQLAAELSAFDRTSFDFLAEETSSPSTRNALVTHTYDLGWDQGWSDWAGLGLRYDWSGKQDALVAKSWYGSFSVKNASWEFTLLPGYRNITLYSKTGSAFPVYIPVLPLTTPPTFRKIILPATLNLDDRPLGGKLDFTGIEGWLFEISSTRHDYDKAHVGFLLDYISRDLSGGSALTQQQGFLLHENSARIERDFDLTSLALDYEVDQSAVDQTWSYTTDVDLQTPLSVALDLEIVVGATHTLNLPQTRFITLNLIYYP